MRKKGFTLVEILIDITIIALVAAGVLSAYSASFKAIELAKAKTAAVALANEKMEELRNMPYDSLATEHGAIYPPGNLKDEEEFIRRGVRFKLTTEIRYVDDPFDGNATGSIPGKATDLYPYDYKKAEVTVSKVGFKSHLARLTSNIAAKAAETPTNSGIIYFCVIDSTGAPVPEADVSISNDVVDPPVDMKELKTGIDGCIMIPNLPPDIHNHYHLTVTKNGYSIDQTYSRTSQNPNELYADINVIAQQVTPKTLVIDKLSKMIIDVVDTSGVPVPNAVIKIHDSKETYFNPTTYRFDKTLTADSNGHLELSEIGFDAYSIAVEGWQIVSTSPFQPIGLKADETLNVKIVVSNNSGYLTVSNYSPIMANTNDLVQMTINGAGFDTSTIVKLIKSSGEEIVASNLVLTGNSVIDCNFDLVNVPVGNWDILVANGKGESIRQINGFEIKAPN